MSSLDVEQGRVWAAGVQPLVADLGEALLALRAASRAFPYGDEAPTVQALAKFATLRERFDDLGPAPPHLAALEAVLGRALGKFVEAEASFGIALREVRAFPELLNAGAALLEELFAGDPPDEQ